MVWHFPALLLQQIKYCHAMFEIVFSVTLYFGAIVLLVKGAIAFCDNSHDNIVTER